MTTNRLFKPMRLIFGSTRLRFGIPILFVLLPLVFGTAISFLIDSMLEQYSANDITLPLVELRVYVVLLVVANSVLALVLGLAVVYVAVRPLERVQEVADQLAAGQFAERLDFDSLGDEIGHMGRSFNSMVDALHRMFSERNRYMMENFAGAIVTIGLEGTIDSVNPGAAELLGVAEEELTGANFLEMLRHDPVNYAMAEMIEGCISEGNSLFSQQTIYAPPDGVVKGVLISTTRLKEASGQAYRLVINIQNVAKLTDFYRRMNRADRLAAIGTFAMGMAHEIRNPLGSIKGLTQLMMQGEGLDWESRAYGKVILREVDRLDRLLQELLAFSEPKGLTLDRVDLAEVVQSVHALARAKAEDRFELLPESSLDIAEVPHLSLPPDKVQQALLNIVQNAFEAAAGHKADAASGEKRKEPGEVLLKLSLAEDRVRLVVENTGSEIPDDMIDKVFEPFHTTKEDGTGLGLAVSYQILTYIGANIQLSSADNRVTFTIEFPLTLPFQQGVDQEPSEPADAESALDEETEPADDVEKPA